MLTMTIASRSNVPIKFGGQCTTWAHVLVLKKSADRYLRGPAIFGPKQPFGPQPGTNREPPGHSGAHRHGNSGVQVSSPKYARCYDIMLPQLVMHWFWQASEDLEKNLGPVGTETTRNIGKGNILVSEAISGDMPSDLRWLHSVREDTCSRLWSQSPCWCLLVGILMHTMVQN